MSFSKWQYFAMQGVRPLYNDGIRVPSRRLHDERESVQERGVDTLGKQEQLSKR
jgi:hypothetical protein